MKAIHIIVALALIVASLTGCANKSDNNETDFTYSSVSGYRASHSRDIAIEYATQNKEFIDKYGDDFEVIYESGDEEHTFIYTKLFFSGTARHDLKINEDVWSVYLEKSWLGKWEVTGYEPFTVNE